MSALRSATARIALAAFAALALSAGTATVTGMPAHADTSPSQVPFTDPSVRGAVSFTDATGTAITSGNIQDAPTFPVATGDRPAASGDTLVSLQNCVPVENTSPANWNCDTLNSEQSFTAGNPPVNHALVTDQTLGEDIAGGNRNTADPSSGYAGLYQLRLVTRPANNPASPTYYAAVIRVTEGAPTAGSATGSWQVVPGGSTVVTSTTLAVSPSSSTEQSGSSITLSATVLPAEAVGTVTYYEGSTALGTGSSLTLTPADGSHSYTARFAPTDPLGYTSSSSAASAGVFFGNLHQTCTAVTASPPGAVRHGAAVTLTATVWTAPQGQNCQYPTHEPAVAGAVQFADGSHNLGSGPDYTAQSGTATFVVAAPEDGVHPYFTRFTAEDPAYLTSTSTPVSVSVGQVSLSLTGSPPGPVPTGSALTLTAIVAPPVPGTIAFSSRPVGSGLAGTPLSGQAGYDPGSGVGTQQATAPTSAGQIEYVVTFTPQDSAGYLVTSTSPPQVDYQTIRVTPFVTLSAQPAESATAGAPVTLTATVAPTGIAGSVEFFDAGRDLGAADHYDPSSGTASKVLSPATGQHAYSATFQPTDTTQFSTAISDGLSFLVSALPPPTPIIAPGISGTFKVGETGTCSTGRWVTAPTFRLQWQRDGKAIAGATHGQYVFTAADLDHKLACRVTASTAGGSLTSVTRTLTVRTGDAPATRGTAAITGVHQPGAVDGTTVLHWTVSKVSVRYQWLRNGRPLPGATHATYHLTAADRGTRLAVRLTATAAGHAGSTKTLAPVTVR